MSTAEHWETVYRTRSTTEVSWFQTEARTSLECIARAAPSRESAVIDIGGGASTLVEGLLALGYRDVSVLDIASAALEHARARMGPAAAGVQWIAADVLEHRFAPQRFDVWHDRAVFHFLTMPERRRAYVVQVKRALRINGCCIIATFAPDGPARCSGLEVCRYSPRELRDELGVGFELLDEMYEDHVTPSGAHQSFQYSIFRYGGNADDDHR